MNAKDKEDWVIARFGRGTFVDPVAFYDALHGGRDGRHDAIHNVGLADRIAEVLRLIILRHFDSAGHVTDPAGLMEKLRSVADALGAK